jgi:hypothetical protein
MAKHSCRSFTFGFSLLLLACGSDNGDTPAPSYDAGGVITTPQVTIDSGAAPGLVDAGAPPVTPVRDAGSTTVIDSGATSTLDSGGSTTSDSGSVTSDAGDSDAAVAGGTSLTGMYGSLGAVKPIVSSIWISTGLETLLYLSSTPLSCDVVAMEGGKWLLKLPSGSQVLEIVVRGMAKVGTVRIPGGEANYAQGGVSSATEKTASSGSLMFTKVEAKGVIEGSVMATYSAGSVMGNFHAEFCQGGQEW